MKLHDTDLEELNQQLKSMPKPNLKTAEKNKIYNTLIHMEQTQPISPKKNSFSYRLSKLTVSLLSVAMLMIFFIISLSYFQSEKQTGHLSSQKDSHLNQNTQNSSNKSAQGGTSTNQNFTQFSYSGMTYTINSVKRTKEKGSLPILKVLKRLKSKNNLSFDSYFDGSISFNNEGKITNNFSYIIANVTIQNNSGRQKETWLNACSVLGKNKKGVYVDKFEPMIFDKRLDIESGDYFRYILQPKESVTFNLGFIIPDKKLDLYINKMDLIYNIPGTNDYDDPNVHVIKINDTKMR